MPIKENLLASAASLLKMKTKDLSALTDEALSKKLAHCTVANLKHFLLQNNVCLRKSSTLAKRHWVMIATDVLLQGKARSDLMSYKNGTTAPVRPVGRSVPQPGPQNVGGGLFGGFQAAGLYQMMQQQGMQSMFGDHESDDDSFPGSGDLYGLLAANFMGFPPQQPAPPPAFHAPRGPVQPSPPPSSPTSDGPATIPPFKPPNAAQRQIQLVKWGLPREMAEKVIREVGSDSIERLRDWIRKEDVRMCATELSSYFQQRIQQIYQRWCSAQSRGPKGSPPQQRLEIDWKVLYADLNEELLEKDTIDALRMSEEAEQEKANNLKMLEKTLLTSGDVIASGLFLQSVLLKNCPKLKQFCLSHLTDGEFEPQELFPERFKTEVEEAMRAAVVNMLLLERQVTKFYGDSGAAEFFTSCATELSALWAPESESEPQKKKRRLGKKEKKSETTISSVEKWLTDRYTSVQEMMCSFSTSKTGVSIPEFLLPFQQSVSGDDDDEEDDDLEMEIVEPKKKRVIEVVEISDSSDDD